MVGRWPADRPGAEAIVPRMVAIAAVREAEAWTLPNIVGGIVLVVLAILALVWLIRRYLMT